MPVALPRPSLCRVRLDGHVPRMLINYRLGPRWRSLPPCLLSIVIRSTVSSPSHSEGAQKCHRVSLKRFKGCFYMFLLYFSILDRTCVLSLRSLSGCCGSSAPCSKKVLLHSFETAFGNSSQVFDQGYLCSGGWEHLTMRNRVHTQDNATIFPEFVYLSSRKIQNYTP